MSDESFFQNSKSLQDTGRPGSSDTRTDSPDKFPSDAFQTSDVSDNPRILYLRDTWKMSILDDLDVSGDVGVTGDLQITGDIGRGRVPTRALDLYEASAAIYARIENGGANNSGLELKNSVGSWYQIINISGHYHLISNTSTTPLQIEANTPSALIVGRAAGRIEIGGAVAIGSSGRTTITGPTTINDLDVSSIGKIEIDTSGGDVTINGLSGGVEGQPIFVVRPSTSNNLVLNNNNAGGTQKLLVCPDETDVTLGTRYKDVWIFESTYWMVRGD